MSRENTPYYMLQSVERTMMIFEVFIRERRALGITEIADEVKLHKSVVHRHLATLQAFQMLEQLPETGKYQVGPKAFEFGSVYMNNSLIMQGRRILPELAEKIGETAHLAILNQGSVLYLENRESPKSLRMYAPVGVRNPISTSALGKVLVAWKPEAEIRELLAASGMPRRTAKSISTADAYLEELMLVRQRGYAVDDEENAPDFRCVAAPLRDHTDQVVAAISVGGDIRIIHPDKTEAIADVVKTYAVAISERLGYVPKVNVGDVFGMNRKPGS